MHDYNDDVLKLNIKMYNNFKQFITPGMALIAKYIKNMSKIGEIEGVELRPHIFITTPSNDITFMINDTLVDDGAQSAAFMATMPILKRDSDEMTTESATGLYLFCKITINMSEVDIYRVIRKKILVSRVSPAFAFLWTHARVINFAKISQDVDDMLKKQLSGIKAVADGLEDIHNDIVSRLQEDKLKYTILRNVNDAMACIENTPPPDARMLVFKWIDKPMTPEMLIHDDVLFRILQGIRSLHSVGILHTDAHMGNLMMYSYRKLQDNVYHLYEINTKKYYIPINNRNPMIVDFGISVFLRKMSSFDKERMLMEYDSHAVPSRMINDKLRLLDYYSILHPLKDMSDEIEQLLLMINKYIDNATQSVKFDFDVFFHRFEKYTEEHEHVNEDAYVLNTSS